MGVGRSEEGKEIRSEENFVDEWSGEQASARRGRKNGRWKERRVFSVSWSEGGERSGLVW